MTESFSKRNWRLRLFTYRSYTPVPFLLVMLVFAAPTGLSIMVGFVTALIGELIRFWGVAYAGSETRTTGTVGGTQLVTSGPYAYVRNPLYVGNILIYLGVGVMSDALVPYLQLIALAYFVFQYRAIVSIEEAYLTQRFEGWKEYASNVRRFLPRLTQFRSKDNLATSSFRHSFWRTIRSERSSLIALTSMTVLLCVVYILRSAA
jgi:protein-S-isoprenylcysteine O-methyltransferase Ste14